MKIALVLDHSTREYKTKTFAFVLHSSFIVGLSYITFVHFHKRDAVHPPKYFPIVGPMAGGDGISQGRHHARGV